MFKELSDTYRSIAKQDQSLWKWISIDHEGNVSETLMTQEGVYNCMPEVNPKFFIHFGVKELIIRQTSTTLILKKVR